MKTGWLTLLAFVFMMPAVLLLLGGASIAQREGWDAASKMVLTGGVLGLIGAAVWSIRRIIRTRQQRAQAVRRAHPQEPWLWYKKWQTCRIEDSSRKRMIWAWVCGLGFLAAWGPTGIVAVREAQDRGSGMGWVLLGAIVFSVGALVWPIACTVRWVRFGRSTLELATFPGIIGGQLIGIIHMSRKLRTLSSYHLKLQCLEKTRIVRHGETESVVGVLWEDEAALAREITSEYPDHTAVPVGFPIPYQCAESDYENPERVVYWRLDVHAKTSRGAYRARFEVPIYRTPESSAQPVAGERDPLAAYRADAALDPKLRGITVREIAGGGMTFRFGAARSIVMAMAHSVLALLCGSAAIALAVLGHVVVVAALVGVVAAALAVLALRLWLLVSTVSVQDGKVQIAGTLLGISSKRDVSTADVISIKCRVTQHVGRDSLYSVIITLKNGETIVAGRWIPGKIAAEWITGKMQIARGFSLVP